MPMLTAAQRRDRAALIEDFRKRIVAAMWEAIEDAPPELLCSDDGTPYGAMVTESLRMDSLGQMARECAAKACKHLENWL